MIVRILVYLNTFRGRTALLVCSFLFILLLFCSYVYVKSNLISKQFDLYKNRWHPLQINFFTTASSLTMIQSSILEALHNGKVDSKFIIFNDSNDVSGLNKNFMNPLDSMQVDFDYKTPINQFKKILKQAHQVKIKVYNRINYLKSKDPALIQSDSLLNIVYFDEMKTLTLSFWVDFFDKLVYPIGYGAENVAKNLREELYYLVFTIVVFSIVMALLYIYLWRVFVKSIKNSMRKPVVVLEKLAEGELTVENDNSKNELTAIINASNKLVINLKKATDFSLEIGKGNFDFEYQPIGNKDVLGNALLVMRNELKLYAEKENETNWSNVGYAKFSEILHNSEYNLEELSNIILKNIVKYLNANQAGMFVYDQDSDTLKMTACYAYDRKKYAEKILAKGQGLVGQCFFDSKTTYLSDVPQNYIEITSGLGSATPSVLLLVPIKSNQFTFGVIEIASFNHFKPHEIAFVEKVCESIATVINTINKNQYNKKLLDESNLVTENIKFYEENMRQNLDELNHTQEMLLQKEVQYNEEIKNLKNKIIELETRLEKLN